MTQKLFETQEETITELKLMVAGHMSEVMTEREIESCIIVTDLHDKGISFAAIGSARSIASSMKTLGILDRNNLSWWKKFTVGLWLIVTCFS